MLARLSGMDRWVFLKSPRSTRVQLELRMPSLTPPIAARSLLSAVAILFRWLRGPASLIALHTFPPVAAPHLSFLPGKSCRELLRSVISNDRRYRTYRTYRTYRCFLLFRSCPNP